MVLTTHTGPTNRLESDMSQESLLQQCTLDSQRAKVYKRERRKCDGEIKTIERFVRRAKQAYSAVEENL